MVDIYIPIWMRGTPMEAVYRDTWIETGDALLSREMVRTTDYYQEAFSGNVRDDGSVRYDEDTYLSFVEAYSDAILSAGLNPDLFQNRYGDLIAGNVSPNEFASRVENVYQRVIDAVPEVRERLNEYYGVGMTNQAIMASFMDADVGAAILEKRIAVSEVGAEASVRGFTIAQEFANRLYEAGTDTTSEAAQFFSLAENSLPVLNALASRHDDPDDDFTLEEFAAAELFSDPQQRRTIRRLLAQERSTFSLGGATMRRSEGYGLTGLADT